LQALLLYAPLAYKSTTDDLLFNAGRFAPLANLSLSKVLHMPALINSNMSPIASELVPLQLLLWKESQLG